MLGLKKSIVPLVITLMLVACVEASQPVSEPIDYQEFIGFIETQNIAVKNNFLEKLDQNWRAEYTAPTLEAMRFSESSGAHRDLASLLREKTSISHADNLNEWYLWLWNQPEKIASDYANFKAELYQKIDPSFRDYFEGRQNSSKIRLDEIRWGGVVRDGIPPLRNPKMISANDASYLQDDNIVFGVEINGDARAYPKRILAWHEMFTDTFGEGTEAEPIAGVYCTLCGTVIIYKTRHDGTDYQLGTSGFLYRSNKLMYDFATRSLWNTVRGEPVLGPLVDKSIALEHLSVVTTTWREWKRRHPNTSVLSLETGHQRDYGEGVAYHNYFSNDRLMFNTPFSDKRLKNKREILALRFPGAPDKQLAIDTKLLAKTPVFYEQVGAQKFVVLTDNTGANRVYDPAGIVIDRYDGLDTAIDSDGNSWRITEQALVNDKQQTLKRLPYHRAFWFGWHAAYPETRLIK